MKLTGKLTVLLGAVAAGGTTTPLRLLRLLSIE
jgi:hypothetical protein